MSRSVTIVRRPVPPRQCGWPESMHPVLRRVYAARGVDGIDALDRRLARLLPPDGLCGLDRAVVLLADAIRNGQRIVVAADYDADGATGAAVAVRGLRWLGAREVEVVVPHRTLHGYGLSPAFVDTLLPRAPALLLTVDNGIASHAGVARARAAGFTVLVTDHHLPGATLPEADAIVNPNVAGDAFPSKALAGVGVMFYLLLALRARLRADGAFGAGAQGPDLAALTDLVALGTVADLVPLDHNNRVLVAAGLKRIRAGHAVPGLRALLALAGRDETRCTETDLGFALGPRINAAGRLEDMAVGIACLLSDDPQQARALALQLDAINAERRQRLGEMNERANRLADAWLARHGTLPAGLCLYDPDWHPGIVGLVATRLRERLERPVIALAPAEPGSAEWRGSGRSVGGFHLRDALASIDAGHPGLLARFGGHAMAAGLTLSQAALTRFSEAFATLAEQRLGRAVGAAILESDGPLAGERVDVALAEQLRDGGPWGQGFPEPCFDDVFELASARPVGDGHWRFALRWIDGGGSITAVHFDGGAAGPPTARMRLLYRLMLDDWGGERRVQLRVLHREPA